jgi:hypothetical protein
MDRAGSVVTSICTNNAEKGNLLHVVKKGNRNNLDFSPFSWYVAVSYAEVLALQVMGSLRLSLEKRVYSAY